MARQINKYIIPDLEPIKKVKKDKNKGVTHRRFIEGAKITGKPNFR